MKLSNKNRNEISSFFGTDELTTHRLMYNLSFGFFAAHFGCDASAKWIEAHPSMYPNTNARNYEKISVDFISSYFELFSKKQFYTESGWKLNKEINKMEFRYSSGYIDIA